MGGRWSVELTSSAVESLRALPRAERRTVMARIDELAKVGLPAGPHQESESAGAVVVAVGDHVLFCLEHDGGLKIIVLAVRSAEGSAGQPVSEWVGRSLLRWYGHWSVGETMRSIFQDVRFAVRSLGRSPGFGAAAILTLALGIAASAAIFSVANGVLLRPLPYGDPESVVTLWTSWDNFPDKTWVSMPEYQLFHQETRTLADLSLYGTTSTTFTSVDSPERVGAAFVTPNIFKVLEVSPVIGRVFTWDEARDPNPGVLLSWDAWRRRYGGDSGIVGRSVELNGTMTLVLGVLPEGFVLPADYASTTGSDVFYPLYVDIEAPAPELGGGGSHGFYGVGRLLPGATVETARADLNRIMTQVEPVGLYSPERRFTPRLFAAKADIVGSARGAILVLLGAVTFVLLIACSNVANLLLSRAEVRTGEVAVRIALGASRGRILRQLLTENLVLAGMAGVTGYVLAFVGVSVLMSIDPDAIPRAGSVSLDLPVVLFTFAVSVLTALLFGTVPAVRVSRLGLGARLREGGRSGRRSPGANRMQGLLVASQMAMAVVLLTGSGLMIRTFVSLLRIDPGFGAENVLTLRLSAPSGRYTDGESVDLFYSELLRRVRDIPGIRSAGAARLLPLASSMGDSFFRPVGYEPGPNESTQGDWQWATPGYLETMGIQVLQGRAFDESDRRGGRPVVLINEVMARRFWGDESPVGRMVRAGGAADTAIVVGVVGNVSHNGLTAEVKTRYYVPLAQVDEDWTDSMRSMTLTIGTEGEPLGYVEAIRREIKAMNPAVPLSEVRTLDDVISESVAQPRFAMVLLGAFAIVALALAVIGIYSVLAYGVNKRRQEIGVRMALGAKGGQVIGLVVRQGMIMAMAGVAIGTGGAWFLADLMSGLLYGVTPQDPATFVLVPALFVVVALLACGVPAVRAARVRPASALRYE